MALSYHMNMAAIWSSRSSGRLKALPMTAADPELGQELQLRNGVAEDMQKSFPCNVGLISKVICTRRGCAAVFQLIVLHHCDLSQDVPIVGLGRSPDLAEYVCHANQVLREET